MLLKVSGVSVDGVCLEVLVEPLEGGALLGLCLPAAQHHPPVHRLRALGGLAQPLARLDELHHLKPSTYNTFG